jgi:fluoride exporter
MSTYLWVGLGSALGGMLRHAVSLWVMARWPGVFPWGTVAVNVSGSLAIGFLFFAMGSDNKWRDLVMVGFLGGYTTFSAFSLQSLNLMREGQWTAAVANVAGSVVLCLGAVALGFWLARVVFPGR